MSGPYREPPVEQEPRRRALDPWKLALLFAWVCDAGRVAIGLNDRRAVTGELLFAALLGVVTVVMLSVSLRRRGRSRG